MRQIGWFKICEYYTKKLEKSCMEILKKKISKNSKIFITLLIFVDFQSGSQFPEIVLRFLKKILTIRLLEVDNGGGQELGWYKWYVYYYKLLIFRFPKSTLLIKLFFGASED